METKANGTPRPIRRLTCCVCGATTRGRQWWNRDSGFGVCRRCFAQEAAKDLAEARRLYGEAGVHHSIAGMEDDQ